MLPHVLPHGVCTNSLKELLAAALWVHVRSLGSSIHIHRVHLAWAIWVLLSEAERVVRDWGRAREAKIPGRGMQRVVRRAPALLVDVVGVLVVLDGCGGKGHRLP